MKRVDHLGVHPTGSSTWLERAQHSPTRPKPSAPAIPQMSNQLPKAAARTASLTEEQMQRWMRIQGIFMPEAVRQRAEVYKRQTGDENSRAPIRFVHYTSADAALKIINSKRLWMRNTNCMADYREVQHGYDMLFKFFSDGPSKSAFLAALDSCVPGVAAEALNLFDGWWLSIRLDTYITSISEHDASEDQHDRLSMWRAFGGSAARVGLVMSVPWYSGGAEALKLLFSPVAYSTEERVHEVIREVIANVAKDRNFVKTIGRQELVTHVFNMLLAGVTCLKHEGFNEEREWRAIYCSKVRPSALMQSSIQVYASVPQRIYQLPLDVQSSPVLADLDFAGIFDRLIIGPTPYQWAMYDAFVDALSKVGITDAGKLVRISNIPIRS